MPICLLWKNLSVAFILTMKVAKYLIFSNLYQRSALCERCLYLNWELLVEKEVFAA